MKNGKPQIFKGSVEFTGKVKSMNGRWIWENKENSNIDFGPDEDEIKDVSTEPEPTPESNPPSDSTMQNNKRKKALFSPWIGLTVAFAPYLDKSYKHFDVKEKQLTILPDLTAIARFQLTFGESDDGFIALGAGGFIGAGIVDGLQRIYTAPAAQAELGYSNFGIRETAIIAFPSEDSDEWSHFRTGLFYNLGLFGIEAGFDMITNLGYGGYATVYLNL
jgi:hypothetical protein